ncbi:biotin-dependent carboxyltransferase family protein [Roseivivax marinus]|uniref:5-oxoprolinase subunit C family protein n=1 Tax=Roseivivax marinus TaxID=1379903 RepID=UPI001F03AF03|nr:biotin-dependent carboxyltransferase family protein [Roseivivax marinus]UMA65469.1 biotin-dependent carboxyltransferase family protein [Roseivivax marinus]
MTARLKIVRAGPQVTVQDLGRTGYVAFGLSRGGAADRLALYEGAALLGQDAGLAALEMAGAGGVFEATADIRIAFTGAPMTASLDGKALTWPGSHDMPAGSRLEIGAARRGTYGYLHVGGGIDVPVILGARSAHLAGGLGAALDAGTELPVGEDPGGPTGRTLPADDRFSGGEVRVVPSVQTDFFPEETRDRLERTAFEKDPRANRMSARMRFEGDGFGVEGGLSVVSEVIVPGDIQVTGDGVPVVLLAESQTTGGYPRIGTVIPSDVARVAQAQPGTPLRFRFVTAEEGRGAEAKAAEARAALPKRITTLVRDPADMADLLSYNLVGGVTRGDDI